MCVNLESSIASYIIGTVSGYLLYKKNKNKELNSIGIFIMWISLIQLVEGIMYYTNYDLSRYLVLLLGFQGLIFTLSYKEKNNIWTILMLIIAIISVVYSLNIKIKKNNYNYNCISWNFLSKYKLLSKSLGIMYIAILIWMFSKEKYYMNIYGTLLIITYIISYFTKNIKNKPSMWCLTSAVISPIMLLIK